MFAGNRKPWSSMMLYGPSGTGKSYLASAYANEISFYSLNHFDFVNSWAMEGENLIK